MEQLVSGTVALRRFRTALVGAFAATALLLVALGLYSLIAYGVTQRTHELGLRLALGARPQDIFGLVVGQALRLTLAGLAVGACVSLATWQLVAGQLYGVTSRDPMILSAVALLFLVVALIASFLPARRASRLAPILALRQE
jgi:putative ABC transport system permease protein